MAESVSSFCGEYRDTDTDIPCYLLEKNLGTSMHTICKRCEIQPTRGLIDG